MKFYLLAVVIGSVAAGQMCVKAASRSLYTPKAFTALELGRMALINLTNPLVIASLLFTAIGGLSWILVIKEIPLSRAYPFLSLNFAIVFLLSWLVFGEQLSTVACVGLVAIMVGTALLGLR